MQGGTPDRRVDVARALRDAGFTALLAFGLFLPLIGFQTVTNIRNDLILTTRWPLLFAIVAVVGLKPTIKGLPSTLASIISGTVTKAADQSAIEGALVSAQVYDAQAADVRDQVVVKTSTLSINTGAYSLFIAAGAYNLVASKLGFGPSAVAITAAAGTTPTQDFSLAAADAGTVSGAASITGAGDETFVTLSFRQKVTLNAVDVMIEIVSINVANGGNYSVDLPAGTYSVVSSTLGMTTQQADVIVNAGATTTFDVLF